MHRSDDGAPSTHFDDDVHQCSGRVVMAAEQNVRGRLPVGGTGRRLPYSN